ncbi:UNVERIFIED_CONTAM: hypothetical protein Slati_0806400 [Sesamum latifolium]|uniref:Integrase catalytic domain-containing protein n=1 Tax=Sesamum latifolium TaxID=2727402 RepID=A0AAW2XKW6_9LAMI
MKMAHEVGARHLLAYLDSQLVVKQIEGVYEAKEKSMVQYLQQIAELRTSFESFQINQIPREKNAKADCLSRLASALEDCRTRHITIQYLPNPRAALTVQAVSSSADWRTPIVEWIEKGNLPDNRWDASRLKARTVRFLIQGGILYKMSYTHPLLRCVSQPEGVHLLKEIHSGCCGSHIGTWMLANKALRARGTYYHVVPMPFCAMGDRHCGSFSPSPGSEEVPPSGDRLFTKWVEAEPLSRITETEVMKFIWRNLVCRFGLPREIISNNGQQFQGKRLQEWCGGLRIKQRFTSVAHPQSNGQVEVTNRILVTTPRGPTNESPFALVYGSEAIILAELGVPSHRIMHFSENHNNELLKENLDLLEELREKAFIRVQRYKNIMINAYNRRVKARSFQVGDLVLRRVDALKSVGKLDPTWEGPYKITSVIGRGAYRLEDLEGRPLPRPWNVHNLKKYYA